MRQVKGLELVRGEKSKPRPGLVLNSGAPYRFDVEPGITLTARRVSMKEFSAWLKMPMAVGQRVEDRTGLPGEYDFVLKWTPQRADGTGPRGDTPTIYTALKEQLWIKAPFRARARGCVHNRSSPKAGGIICRSTT